MPKLLKAGVTQANPGDQAARTGTSPPRSALYGVLVEIDALGLDLLEVRQLAPDLESEDNSDTAEFGRA